MAITISSFTSGSLSANDTCSVTVTGCSTDDTIVVLHIWDGVVTENAPTCSGETVSTVGTQATGNSGWTTKYRWHVINDIQSSGDKTVTATLSGAPSSANIAYAWRLTGAENTSAYDTSANATGTTANPSVNLTTSLSNGAVFAVVETNSGAATAGSGYTGRTLFSTNFAQDDNNVGSAGTYNVAFTHATTTNWGMTAMAIKSADGTAGGSGVPKTTKLAMLGVG
jgi:hypothetical protein